MIIPRNSYWIQPALGRLIKPTKKIKHITRNFSTNDSDHIHQMINRHLGAQNVHLKAEEENLRRLFYEDPNNKVLAQPTRHLFDVHKQSSTFHFHNECNMPLLFSHNRWIPDSGSSIVDLPTFHSRWEQNSPFLKHLNWNNVIAAGGLVLSNLMQHPSNFHKSAASHSNDVDLFLYGMDHQQAIDKIYHIYDAVIKAFGQPVLTVRTSRTLTLVCGFPQRHIQIVLRIYKTPAEVLLAFDLDSCCVAYDGKTVWALPRARRALNYKLNVADPSRQSFRAKNYEYRLWKYSKRGFGVAVPGLEESRINPEIFKKKYAEADGLAKLLLLDRLDRDYEAKMRLRTPEIPKNSGEMDYNQGLLLPLNTRTTTHTAFQGLTARAHNAINNTSASDPVKVNYIYGWNLDQVMDGNNFLLLSQFPQRKFEMNLPRFVEFEDNLEYKIQSLPEPDVTKWYLAAYQKSNNAG